MELTESVRSFHVPATPFTSAWPPSLPSVPTSRATRVTSLAKRVELIHHGVDGVLQLQNFAAHIHRDLARQVAVGHGRGHFGDVADLRRQVAGHGVDRSVRSFHTPPTPFTSACPPSLPSVPTSRATRVTSLANAVELVHHGVDGVLQLQNFAARVHRDLGRQDRRCATAVVTSAMLRTWFGQVARHRVDALGQILPDAADALAPAPGRPACLRFPLRAPRASLRARTN